MKYYVYSKQLKAFYAGNAWRFVGNTAPATAEELKFEHLPSPYFMLTQAEQPRVIQEQADAFNIALANFNHVEAMKPENQHCVVIELCYEPFGMRVWEPPSFVSKTFYKRKWE